MVEVPSLQLIDLDLISFVKTYQRLQKQYLQLSAWWSAPRGYFGKKVSKFACYIFG